MKEPKLKTIYVCSNCGETSPRWMGRCPSCGSWNTMSEDIEEPKDLDNEPDDGFDASAFDKTALCKLDEMFGDKLTLR